MDRIEHASLEVFKEKVLQRKIKGQTIRQWTRILGEPENASNAEKIKQLIEE